MIAYLDTSVVLRWLFAEANPYKGWGHWHSAASSALLRVEACRVLDRKRLVGALDDAQLAAAMSTLQAVLQHLSEIHLNQTIAYKAAASFPIPVRTLNAIHLASALAWRESGVADICFITHDKQQAIAAQALGFRVAGAGAP